VQPARFFFAVDPSPQRAVLVRLLVGFSLIAGIGAVDYVTGLEIRIFPLYFAPVAYVAAGLGAWPGVGVSVLCTSTWLGSSLAAGNPHPAWLIASNATLQLGACAVVALMIARMRVLLRSEHEHARRDALTGLANRRALAERASVEIARLGRGAAPLVVASLDLDRFKSVNDQEGHAAGDRLLQHVARIVHDRLRAADMVARIGGDEFTLLLPDTSEHDARIVLERVRAALAIEMSAAGWPVTASIGAVVVNAADGASLDAALELADAALYEAKRSGRDRVHVAVLR
jgi:diguanylate cyclase (GGDEF)-like protein